MIVKTVVTNWSTTRTMCVCFVCILFCCFLILKPSSSSSQSHSLFFVSSLPSSSCCFHPSIIFETSFDLLIHTLTQKLLRTFRASHVPLLSLSSSSRVSYEDTALSIPPFDLKSSSGRSLKHFANSLLRFGRAFQIAVRINLFSHRTALFWCHRFLLHLRQFF